MVKPYVDVFVHLTTLIPSHSQVTTKPIPLDPRQGPSEPSKGVVVTCTQLVVSYSRPHT